RGFFGSLQKQCRNQTSPQIIGKRARSDRSSSESGAGRELRDGKTYFQLRSLANERCQPRLVARSQQRNVRGGRGSGPRRQPDIDRLTVRFLNQPVYTDASALS